MEICVSVTDEHMSRDLTRDEANDLLGMRMSGKISVYGHPTNLIYSVVLKSAHHEELGHIGQPLGEVDGRAFEVEDYIRYALAAGWTVLEPLLASTYLSSAFWNDLTSAHFPKTDSQE